METLEQLYKQTIKHAIKFKKRDSYENIYYSTGIVPVTTYAEYLIIIVIQTLFNKDEEH